MERLSQRVATYHSADLGLAGVIEVYCVYLCRRVELFRVQVHLPIDWKYFANTATGLQDPLNSVVFSSTASLWQYIYVECRDWAVQ